MLECPNGSNNGNKRPKSFGSSMNDNITVVCYSCQGTGHFASGQCPVFWKRRYSQPHLPCLECPSKGAKKTPTTFSENNTKDECFKCGKLGHWSNGMYMLPSCALCLKPISFALRVPAEC